MQRKLAVQLQLQ